VQETLIHCFPFRPAFLREEKEALEILAYYHRIPALNYCVRCHSQNLEARPIISYRLTVFLGKYPESEFESRSVFTSTCSSECHLFIFYERRFVPQASNIRLHWDHSPGAAAIRASLRYHYCYYYCFGQCKRILSHFACYCIPFIRSTFSAGFYLRGFDVQLLCLPNIELR